MRRRGKSGQRPPEPPATRRAPSWGRRCERQPHGSRARSRAGGEQVRAQRGRRTRKAKVGCPSQLQKEATRRRGEPAGRATRARPPTAEGRRRVRAATRHGPRPAGGCGAHLAVRGQRARAGAARAAAAGAAFPASRAARGTRAGSAGRGAWGRFAPPLPPPLPRLRRRASYSPPSPGETRAPHPAPDLPGPRPRHCPSRDGPPRLAPEGPVPQDPHSFFSASAPERWLSGIPYTPPRTDLCGSPVPKSGSSDVAAGLGGREAAAGGGRARYKGPEAARAEPRDVARPPCWPHLQVRACPQAEPGLVEGVGRGRGATGTPRL